MKLKILFLILAFSCGILIGLGLYFVIPPAKTSIKTADLVDDIQEDLGEEYDEEKYSKIKKEYPNIGGWIYIDEIGLSQPIMEDRGEYYLNHAYNDEEVASGALFYRPEDNTIYGHHMKDGSMFGKLEEYHNEIYTVVIDDIKDDGSYVRHTYEVEGAYVWDGDDPSFIHNACPGYLKLTTCDYSRGLENGRFTLALIETDCN